MILLYSLFVFLFAGVPGVNRSAHGDVRVCGCFHLRARSEGVRPSQHLDVLPVLRRVLGVRLCDQLLRKCPPKTPLESGGVGKRKKILQ